MSEMIERVARDIHATSEECFTMEACELLARAAIKAMRDPTKTMLNSTADIVVYYDDFALNDGTCYMSEDSAERAFKAMIDAALKEKA